MRVILAAITILFLSVQASTAEPSYISLGRTHIGKTGPQLGLPATLWCADWVNLVLERSGIRGTKSRAAASFLSWRKVPGPQVGAIVVTGRGGKVAHVGIVTGVEADGDPIILSGNSYRRQVYEGAYPRSSVIAYVVP